MVVSPVHDVQWPGYVPSTSCPAICRASTSSWAAKQDVDGRDKPGHDGCEVAARSQNAALRPLHCWDKMNAKVMSLQSHNSSEFARRGLMRLSLLKFAGLLAVGLGFVSQAHAQTTPITFALDFRALGRHAAWYVALEKGYYKSAGL